jgi:hypothetical protein
MQYLVEILLVGTGVEGTRLFGHRQQFLQSLGLASPWSDPHFGVTPGRVGATELSVRDQRVDFDSNLQADVQQPESQTQLIFT